MFNLYNLKNKKMKGLSLVILYNILDFLLLDTKKKWKQLL